MSRPSRAATPRAPASRRACGLVCGLACSLAACAAPDAAVAPTAPVVRSVQPVQPSAGWSPEVPASEISASGIPASKIPAWNLLPALRWSWRHGPTGPWQVLGANPKLHISYLQPLEVRVDASDVADLSVINLYHTSTWDCVGVVNGKTYSSSGETGADPWPSSPIAWSYLSAENLPPTYRLRVGYVVSMRFDAGVLATRQGNACWVTTMPPGVPQPTGPRIQLRALVFSASYMRLGSLQEYKFTRTFVLQLPAGD